MPIWPSSRGSTLADVDSPDARKYDSAINLDDLALYQNRFSVRMQSGERALENAPRVPGAVSAKVEAPIANSDGSTVFRAPPLFGNVMDEWPTIGTERTKCSHELPEV